MVCSLSIKIKYIKIKREKIEKVDVGGYMG